MPDYPNVPDVEQNESEQNTVDAKASEEDRKFVDFGGGHTYLSAISLRGSSVIGNGLLAIDLTQRFRVFTFRSPKA